MGNDQAIGSERLRKAIARNKAKQSRRNSRVKSNDSAKKSYFKSETKKSSPSFWERNLARETVGSTGDIQFTRSLKRKPTKSRSAWKASQPESRSSKILLRLGQVVCLFLVLRLTFSERGVIDYFNTDNFIKEKKEELSLLKISNQELERENRLILRDVSYQKKLVRDHLGFIAHDEYLILFAKGEVKKPTSTLSQL